jgi:EAL domain-containing protein (putative c-di-GMP-specific phosphodiesterase class I)
LEVTESVFLGRSAAHVRRTLETLSEAGVKVALDDFGTGFASLSHLKQFPVDIIKIDRSFINHLQVDEQDGAIVHALIGLASALKLEVVAEGVETTAQRDFLKALGCTTAQGYLFGKAGPSASVRPLLDEQNDCRQAAA